jgi:hypothetical protein
VSLHTADSSMVTSPAQSTPLTRWTEDDILGVQWVIMRFLAVGSTPRETIQRRLHWADHMLPCLQTPSVKGFGFGQVPNVGPLLALCSFITNCQRRPSDWEWCRTVLHEAQLDLPEMLAAIEPFAHLYADAQDVPVQIFQCHPDAYALVPLTDLPFGHSMHSCAHEGYFDAQHNRIVRRAKVLRFVGKPRDESAERTEAGRRLTCAVSIGELDPCFQHATPIDWGKINRAAEHIRTTVRPWTRATVQAASQQATGLSDAELTRLENLFIDPIRWTPGSPEVVGGQHRLCGYRVAGQTHAFVAIGVH